MQESNRYGAVGETAVNGHGQDSGVSSSYVLLSFNRIGEML